MIEIDLGHLVFEIVLLTASVIFLSIFALAGGYFGLKLKQGILSENEVPKWVSIIEKHPNLRINAISNSNLGYYVEMFSGVLIIRIFIGRGLWHWYHHGFDQNELAVIIFFTILNKN